MRLNIRTGRFILFLEGISVAAHGAITKLARLYRQQPSTLGQRRQWGWLQGDYRCPWHLLRFRLNVLAFGAAPPNNHQDRQPNHFCYQQGAIASIYLAGTSGVGAAETPCCRGSTVARSVPRFYRHASVNYTGNLRSRSGGALRHLQRTILFGLSY